MEAGGFVVQTMNIENTGVGAAEVNAEKDLKVKDSFLGKVKNKGGAKVKKLVEGVKTSHAAKLRDPLQPVVEGGS